MNISLTNKTILVLDDEKNIRKSIEMVLRAHGANVLLAHEPGMALRVLNNDIIDVLLLDIRLGDFDGLSFFKKIRADGYDVPTIFISGNSSLSEAVEAVKIGGFDFLEKPFKAEKLSILVQRCIEHAALEIKLKIIEGKQAHTEIIGESGSIKRLKTAAIKVAGTDASVFIHGESGTGKELVANLIHAHSRRSDAPLVKVNCSAIPETLIESELFGHEKGAFTGASRNKSGYFEQAHCGTLFLDEIGDLSLSAQAKVLRTLQSGDIQKVGADTTLKVDVRILSGTHKNLKTAVADGTFREDLLYRLNVVPINVPTLRSRSDDIPLLIHYFLKMFREKYNTEKKHIDDDSINAMCRYHWPGNVRELANIIERLVIMTASTISLSDIPEEIMITSSTEQAKGQKTQTSLKDFRDQTEREYILKALKFNHGNITQTAKMLDVARTYLHKRLGQLGVEKKDYFQ